MTSEVATYGDARDRIDRIKAHVTAAWSDIVDAYRQRDWITLGYADWDTLCAEEFGGARIALPIDDRREVVADLRGAGMSTRAIASAVGVSDGTVRTDLDQLRSSTQLPETVTGLDGRTRPAHVTQTTRTTEATKVEHAVDLATGEILDDVVTSEQWEAENRLADFIDADPDIQDAKYRANLSKVVAQVSILPKYDPERVADLLDDDGWYALELVMKSAHEWHQKIAARRRRTSPLTLIGGSK